MRISAGWSALVLVAVLVWTDRVEALNVSDFMAICAQAGGKCEEVPILQAYIGGALDLVAMLHEETDYVKPIYCKDTRLLFDVPAIIKFIEDNQAGNEKKNAMMLMIRFLEKYGGC